MLSVVIRTKNEEKELSFLLKNLTQRYATDIDEIIVLDNLSTDNTKVISKQFNDKFVTTENFSYGGSANLAAQTAKNDIVVIFSAHCYPVGYDFFKLIIEKFKNRENELAGLRCIHFNRDYKLYIEGISADTDYNGANNGMLYWRNKMADLKKSSTYQFGLLCKKLVKKLSLLTTANKIFLFIKLNKIILL